ncbi:MAG: thymidylate kinase, partial [Pseudomonas sp.]
GLSSTVIHTLAEHVACTQAFERAVADHGWVLCRNEGTIEGATRQVVAEIYNVLESSQRD